MGMTCFKEASLVSRSSLNKTALNVICFWMWKKLTLLTRMTLASVSPKSPFFLLIIAILSVFHYQLCMMQISQWKKRFLCWIYGMAQLRVLLHWSGTRFSSTCHLLGFPHSPAVCCVTSAQQMNCYPSTRDQVLALQMVSLILSMR